MIPNEINAAHACQVIHLYKATMLFTGLFGGSQIGGRILHVELSSAPKRKEHRADLQVASFGE